MANHNSKHSTKTIKAIINEYLDGTSLNLLSKRHNISAATIRGWVEGITKSNLLREVEEERYAKNQGAK